MKIRTRRRHRDLTLLEVIAVICILLCFITSLFIGTSTLKRETLRVERKWQSITSSADGTKLAAVEKYGYIYTSTDSGVSWTARKIKEIPEETEQNKTP